MKESTARYVASVAHVFTALGAVCALFATLALIDLRFERMFLWLGLALVIDGLDGTVARWVDVEQRLPRFSGERLDLVIDYVTFVFIPALALLRAELLTGVIGYLLAAGILMSSLFHFSDVESKDAAHQFVGFPAVWNLVAFYLFAFDATEVWACIVVALCIILTFVPMKWIHPLRVAFLRPVTLAITAGWALAAMAVVVRGFPATAVLQIALILAALYVIMLSVMDWRRSREVRE